MSSQKWKDAHKEGDVKEDFDKDLSKSVVKIGGSTSASNYIQIPSSKSKTKSLGLTGQYANKWNVVQIDIKNLLTQNIQSLQKFELRSLQVCANVNIRGIYTSDIQYNVNTLPKDVQLKLKKGETWTSKYQWISHPDDLSEVATQAKQESKQKPQMKSTLKKEENKAESKRNVQFQKASSPSKGKKKKKLNADLPDEPLKPPTPAPQFAMLQKENVGINSSSKNYMEKLFASNGMSLSDQFDSLPQKEQSQHIENFKIAYKERYYDIKFHEPLKPSVPLNGNSNASYSLKPDPIMRLNRVLGRIPQVSSTNIEFNLNPKFNSELLFSSSNILIGQNISATGHQRFFFQHKLGIKLVSALAQNYIASVTGPVGGKKDECEVIIWDNHTGEPIIQFRPSVGMITNIILSPNEEMLLITGLDVQNRDIMIVYDFNQLVNNRKIETVARRLSDSNIFKATWSRTNPSVIYTVGKENITFWRVKNGHLTFQQVVLNNHARDQIFTSVLHLDKQLIVSSNKGNVLSVNTTNKSLEFVLNIHSSHISSLTYHSQTGRVISTSFDGLIRMWDTSFKTMSTEIQINQPIISSTLNSSNTQIAVMLISNSIMSVNLETQESVVQMRSHNQSISDFVYNYKTQSIVSMSSQENKIRVWNALNLQQKYEFEIQNDTPNVMASNDTDPTFAVGFKSGAVRVLDILRHEVIYETLNSQSAVKAITFSQNGDFLAVQFADSEIQIFSVHQNYQCIKVLTYDYPNHSYYGLQFSPDSKLLANIANNSNAVTIWETQNFSLRYNLDLSGNVIAQIQFAPNNKDLLVLTANSKMKYFRLQFNGINLFKEIPGLHDHEVTSFFISHDNQYLLTCGKEGQIKIFDYFMRGHNSFQTFLGHTLYANKIIMDDQAQVWTTGPDNGLYRWDFLGEIKKDASKEYEEIQEEQKEYQQTKYESTQYPLGQGIETNKVLSLAQTNTKYSQGVKEYPGQLEYSENQELLKEQLTQHQEMMDDLNNRFEIDQPVSMQKYGGNPMKTTSVIDPVTMSSLQAGSSSPQYDFDLKQVLGYSSQNVKDNLVWMKDKGKIAYTLGRIVIVEEMGDEKKQVLLKDSIDPITKIIYSKDFKLIVGFNSTAPSGNFPQIFIWDANTLNLIQEISIQANSIFDVALNNYSNMLLVTSQDQEGEINVQIWDFLDRRKQILSKSVLLGDRVVQSTWNTTTKELEFIVVTEKDYYFWKMTPELKLLYQQGTQPKKPQDDTSKFICCDFYIATNGGTFLLLGKTNGVLSIVDANTNTYIQDFQLTQNLQIKAIQVVNQTITHSRPDNSLGVLELEFNGESFSIKKQNLILLDGEPISLQFSELDTFGVVSSSNSTFWVVDLAQQTTVQLKQLQLSDRRVITIALKGYLDQDQPGMFQCLLGASFSGGIVKLWNASNFTEIMQFYIPNEECNAIAYHPTFSYLIAGFDSGYLRFFNYDKQENLGRCRIQENDSIQYIHMLPCGKQFYAVTKNGCVMFVKIQSWEPLNITLQQLSFLNQEILSFDVSFYEPYNKFLISTTQGKVFLFNQRDQTPASQVLYVSKDKPFNNMDSFNVSSYVDNNYSEIRAEANVDLYYMMKKNTAKLAGPLCKSLQAKFSQCDLSTYACFVETSQFIFIRNFELHQIVRKLSFGGQPREISLLKDIIIVNQDGKYIQISQIGNQIIYSDYFNDQQKRDYDAGSNECAQLTVNTKFMSYSGENGEVMFWHLNQL